MSYIDSSVHSPLEDARGEADAEEMQEAFPVTRPRRTVPRKGMKAFLAKRAEDLNLARSMDQQDLDRIGAQVIDGFNIDERSRDDWASDARKALDFAMQKTQPKTTPWQGASNVIFPLITQACLDFQARTMPAIIQGKAVVKGLVWGDDKGTPLTVDGKPGSQQVTKPSAPGQPPEPQWVIKPGERRKRADRVAQHMSWQLLKQMKEWLPQVDAMIMQIPATGGALKKTFFDPIEKQNRSDFVSLIDVVWDYHATSFIAAPRHSERIVRYMHEIHTAEETDLNENEEGVWLRLDYGPTGGNEAISDVEETRYTHDSSDEDAPHVFIEQHCRIDLDEDGYPEPYVVTIHERSAKVVRVVARYEKDGIHVTPDGAVVRIDAIQHYTLFPFLPSIDGGSYPTGFGHLLRHLNDAINATLNQMFDAGTLANTGSGIMGSDVTLPSGEVGFRVGRWIRAKTKPGTRIQDQVMPIPFPGPNQTLFQLLGLLVSAGEKMASIQEVLSGDAGIANAPPTTVLALIEQGMKLNNAIHTRIFLSLGEEFEKLFELNRRHLTETQQFEVDDEIFEITPEDYALSGGVEPVANAKQTTDMQKLGRAGLIQSIAWGNPLFNQQEVATRILDAGNVDRIGDLFAPPDPNAQIMGQLALEKAQAELGRERAAEQKDMTQAFLNMAMAREKANAEQQAQIDQQMNWMRLQIEDVNAKARQTMAQVAAHKAILEHHRGMHKLAIDAASAAADAVPDNQAPTPATPQPGPSGPFPSGGPQALAAPAPAPMPPTTPSDNARLPPLPGPGDNPLAGAPGVGGPGQ